MTVRPPKLGALRPRWLVLMLLALCAPALFLSSPADANETNTNDWTLATNVSDIYAVDANGNLSLLADISGVAIGDDGAIYAVDNGTRNIYCLSSAGSYWEAQVVNGSSLPARDIEGIGWIGGDEFAVAWEDKGGNVPPSGLSQVTISGLDATVTGNVDLPPIAESGVDNAGGAEGIASAGAPGQFWVVQEGLVVNNVAQPTLYPVNVNNAIPVGDPVALDAGLDAAGVAVEPGDSTHVWVVSEADTELRKFVASGPNAGAQVGSGLATALAEPEGIAFTPDGIHLIVVGENSGQPSQIAIYAQSTSQAPVPTGNCDGPQTPCPSADMTISPNPAMIGDEVTVVVTVNDCDPSVEVTRTRIQIWNDEIDFFGSTTSSLIDVYEDLETHTFVGEAIASGEAQIAVNVSIWFNTWNDDGTPAVPGEATDALRETITIESSGTPDMMLMEIRNERNNRYLHAEGAKVLTETTGASLWNIVSLPNGNVHVINANDGTYLDIDASWVTPVKAVAAPEPLGSEWILRSHANGSFYITNADYKSGVRERPVNIRTTYNSRPDAQVRTTTWNSPHTRWFIESPT